MRHLLAIVGLIAVSHVALARPAEIILLRHAEKPADDRAVDLSPRGLERAQALPNFIKDLHRLVVHALPSALFAARPTAHGRSRRAEETVEPLSRALKLPVQTPFEAGDYKRLARMLEEDRKLDGQVVVVCWVHDFIPQLAAALGVKSPPDWKGSDFDHAWVISGTHREATMKIVAERLLPGDSRH